VIIGTATLNDEAHPGLDVQEHDAATLLPVYGLLHGLRAAGARAIHNGL
jgi:hypothetical protein